MKREAGEGALVLRLLATQLLWIKRSTEAGAASALGFDPKADGLMARKPRRHDERMIDGWQ